MLPNFLCRPRTWVSTLVVVAVAAIVAGCSSDTSTNPLASGSKNLSLSFAVAKGSAAITPSGDRLAPRADVQVGGAAGAANTITITGVQAVVANMRLRVVGGSCTPGPGDFHRCNYLSRTPTLVTLPVDGSVTTALGATVPAATYSGMHIEIAAIRNRSDDHGERGDSSEAAARAAFVAANPSFAGVSIRVTGTYVDSAGTSHPFTYNGSDDADLRIDFPTPVTVDSTGKLPNVTIAVDLARFFVGPTGAVLDPTNPRNAGRIMANIEHAFHGFRDDGRRGVDEHGDGRGAGDSQADDHPDGAAPDSTGAAATSDTTHHG